MLRLLGGIIADIAGAAMYLAEEFVAEFRGDRSQFEQDVADSDLASSPAGGWVFGCYWTLLLALWLTVFGTIGYCIYAILRQTLGE